MPFWTPADWETIVRLGKKIESLEQRAHDLARPVEMAHQQTLARSNESIEALEPIARDPARSVETARQPTLLQSANKTEASEQKARNPADLILLDLMLRGMDGFSAAEHILRRSALVRPTILLFSSAGKQGDMARCAALAAAAYLVKPIKHSELLDAIGMAFANTAKCSASGAPHRVLAAVTGARQMRTLVAEDNAVNSMVAIGILETAAHSVPVKTNGHVVRNALERAPFDLVLLDEQMPIMGGFEAVARIREREKGTDQASSNCSPDHQSDEWRPRAMPECGHGRPCWQTHPGRGTLRGLRRCRDWSMAPRREEAVAESVRERYTRCKRHLHWSWSRSWGRSLSEGDPLKCLRAFRLTRWDRRPWHPASAKGDNNWH